MQVYDYAHVYDGKGGANGEGAFRYLLTTATARGTQAHPGVQEEAPTVYGKPAVTTATQELEGGQRGLSIDPLPGQSGEHQIDGASQVPSLPVPPRVIIDVQHTTADDLTLPALPPVPFAELDHRLGEREPEDLRCHTPMR